VLNSATYKRYRDRRKQMNQAIATAKAIGETGAHVKEMHLWHGSPFSENICKEGFSLGSARSKGRFGKGKLLESVNFYCEYVVQGLNFVYIYNAQFIYW
jgi:hypothetical protein